MAQAALFARLDCNGDGKVSRSECRLRGLVATDIHDLFALGDADSDGLISLSEFEVLAATLQEVSQLKAELGVDGPATNAFPDGWIGAVDPASGQTFDSQQPPQPQQQQKDTTSGPATVEQLAPEKARLMLDPVLEAVGMPARVRTQTTAMNVMHDLQSQTPATHARVVAGGMADETPKLMQKVKRAAGHFEDRRMNAGFRTVSVWDLKKFTEEHDCWDMPTWQVKEKIVVSGEKTVFLSHLCINAMILPRQARDKHRENSQGTQQRTVFSQQPKERSDILTTCKGRKVGRGGSSTHL